MANQVFDGNLQWHDFINPVGMISWMGHKAKDLFANGSTDATPNPNESFNDFYKRVSKSSSNPDSIFGKLNNAFSGNVDALRDAYSNWYNQQSVNDRAYADYELDRMLRQTEYQDMVKSMQDAGLNPYVLLANGASAAGSQSINSSPASYSSTNSKVGGKAAFAAFLYAIARIAAAVITKGGSLALGM